MLFVEKCVNNSFIFFSFRRVFQSYFFVCVCDGNVVFFLYTILFKCFKFISYSYVSVCSVWFGGVVFRLLLVCGSFRLDCSCLSIFGMTVIVLMSCCLDWLFVFWRISSNSRSENQPFFIFVLTWSVSISLFVLNLEHSSQIRLVLFPYPLSIGLFLNNSEVQVGFLP